MHTKPLVSIIINNYNYARFLKDAIDSAIQQTYPETEVIVVDDGSSDHSNEIIAEYGNKIIPLVKENAGQASCFNKGFKISRGEAIIFLDADDYLAKNVAEKVVGSFDDDNISKVHWRLHRVGQNNKLSGQTLPDKELAEGDRREFLIRYGPSQCGGPPHSPPTSGNAWSRKYLEQVLPMPEKIFRGGADNYLFVLAPLYGTIRKINEPLGFYRVHGSNNTVKSSYITTYFDRFEQCCLSLSEHLAIKGIQIDPSSWPRDHWYHKVHTAMEMVKQNIREGSSFILIDDNHWMTDRDFFGRERIPFLELNGQAAGPPSDDKTAIEEIEKHIAGGAAYLVLPWSCYWYFSHYSGLENYVENKFTCILNHDLVKIFDLNHRVN